MGKLARPSPTSDGDMNLRTLYVKTRRATEAREAAPELTATHWIRADRAAWMSVSHSA